MFSGPNTFNFSGQFELRPDRLVPLNTLPLRTQGKASNDKYSTVTDPAKLKPGESDPDQCLNYEATLLKTSWQTLNFEWKHHEECCGSGSASILIAWTRIQVGKK
jgi:hypothetical protein